MSALTFSPFAALLEPNRVLDAVRASPQLNALGARTVRPLDTLPRVKVSDEMAAFDAEVDADGSTRLMVESACPLDQKDDRQVISTECAAGTPAAPRLDRATPPTSDKDAPAVTHVSRRTRMAPIKAEDLVVGTAAPARRQLEAPATASMDILTVGHDDIVLTAGARHARRQNPDQHHASMERFFRDMEQAGLLSPQSEMGALS